MAEVARPERNSAADGEGAQNRLHLILLVRGEEGEHVDYTELVWNLQNLFRDSVERPEMWERYCMEALKSVVANSKPRHAMRDAVITMKTVLLREELGFSVDAIHERHG